MFDFATENERRVTDDEGQAPLRDKVQKKGKKTGPSFAAQRHPPWDPLSGQPPPWGDKLFDPIAGTDGAMPAVESPLLSGVSDSGLLGDMLDEQSDTPPLPEREIPKAQAQPGQPDDAPPLPARERPRSQKSGEPDDTPVDRNEERARAKPQEEAAGDSADEFVASDAAAPGPAQATPAEEEGGQHHRPPTVAGAQKEHQLGVALPQAMRDMERAFGEDLSGVRVQTELPAAARAAGARAMAEEELIAFDPTTLSFDRPEGRHILAHELAHILQKRRQTNPPKREWPDAQGEGHENAPTDQDDSIRHDLEREADEAGRRAAQGLQARVGAPRQQTPKRLFFGLRNLFEKARQGARGAQQQMQQASTDRLPGKGQDWRSLAQAGAGAALSALPQPGQQLLSGVQKGAAALQNLPNPAELLQQGAESGIQQLGQGLADQAKKAGGDMKGLLAKAGAGVLTYPEIKKALRGLGKGRQFLGRKMSQKLARLADRLPDLPRQLEQAGKQLHEMALRSDMPAGLADEATRMVDGAERLAQRGMARLREQADREQE